MNKNILHWNISESAKKKWTYITASTSTIASYEFEKWMGFYCLDSPKGNRVFSSYHRRNLIEVGGYASNPDVKKKEVVTEVCKKIVEALPEENPFTSKIVLASPIWQEDHYDRRIGYFLRLNLELEYTRSFKYAWKITHNDSVTNSSQTPFTFEHEAAEECLNAALTILRTAKSSS